MTVYNRTAETGTTDQRKLADRARRLARREGLTLKKSRKGQEVQYRYSLLDAERNAHVYNAAAVQDIVEFLS
jgi:hypothetical protein